MRRHDGNKEDEDATCAEDSVAANYSHASLGARLSHNRQAATVGTSAEEGEAALSFALSRVMRKTQQPP